MSHLHIAWAEMLTQKSEDKWMLYSFLSIQKKSYYVFGPKTMGDFEEKKEFFLSIIEFKPLLFIYWFGHCPWRFNNFFLGIFSIFWMLLLQAYSVLFNLPPCVGGPSPVSSLFYEPWERALGLHTTDLVDWLGMMRQTRARGMIQISSTSRWFNWIHGTSVFLNHESARRVTRL